MNIIVILFLTSISGLLIGYYFCKNLKKNEIFFDECVKLCETFLFELEFRQNRLTTILNDYLLRCKSELNGIIYDYLKSLETNNEFKINRKINNEILTLIYDFFNNLGNSDKETQIDMLSNYKKRFDYYYEQAREKNEKYNTMCMKLGLLFGLAFGILII